MKKRINRRRRKLIKGTFAAGRGHKLLKLSEIECATIKRGCIICGTMLCEDKRFLYCPKHRDLEKAKRSAATKRRRYHKKPRLRRKPLLDGRQENKNQTKRSLYKLTVKLGQKSKNKE